MECRVKVITGRPRDDVRQWEANVAALAVPSPPRIWDIHGENQNGEWGRVPLAGGFTRGLRTEEAGPFELWRHKSSRKRPRHLDSSLSITDIG